MTRYILFVILNLSAVICGAMAAKPVKLVIDNDAGADDAMAIFLALLSEKHFNGPKLIALTTVFGNTNEDNVCKNNQRILKVAGRQDIPIYRGFTAPIESIHESDDNWFGKDGLGDTGENVTGLVPAKGESGYARLIELSKLYEGELTVVTLGPITNIASALLIDPKFLDRLAHLYVGAGHIYSDEHQEAEFNAKSDFGAYHVLTYYATPEKVTILPFSQVQKTCNFSVPWRQEVLGGIDSSIISALNSYEKVSMPRSDRWHALDPAAVAIAIKPDLVEQYKYAKTDIITTGERAGIIDNKFDHIGNNVRIAYAIKTEEYKNFLLDVFRKS